MATLGIDVSYYQGNIDWLSIKNSGVKFAILRLGYTGYAASKTKAIDPMFETYYRNAKAVGIPVGAYYFSRATTVEEGINEATFVLKHLEGKQFEYPIYIDVEDTYYQANTSKENLTAAIKAFCATLEDKKYYVGIYASLYWLNNKIDLNQLKVYDKWVAQWSSRNTFGGSYGMWQYSSTGNIGGVTPVDLNYSYKNFPQIMIDYGLNGYKKKEVEPLPPEVVPDDKDEDNDNNKTDDIVDDKTNNADNTNNGTNIVKKENWLKKFMQRLVRILKLVVNFIEKIL